VPKHPDSVCECLDCYKIPGGFYYFTGEDCKKLSEDVEVILNRVLADPVEPTFDCSSDGIDLV
jgi:hypothetical protein